MRAVGNSLEDKFIKGYTPEPNSGCWLWHHTTGVNGYGVINYGFQKIVASRYSVERATGMKIPIGKVVCHKCDTPACVNPDHLFVGTQRDNIRDCVSKGRNQLGEDRPNAVLTESLVRRIRREYRFGVLGCGVIALGTKYAIGYQLIHRVVNRKIWKHVK